ncbi:MAG: type II toxin-antitoxin system RelE/ParE family toxin [Clostridia bacterium]|nr:type II toxin-antitoxin system RelE/ParE family toxin [Clostridia bacterium]
MEKTKTFKVEFTERAVKQLHKLDKQRFLIIVNWIKKNLEGCENPRLHGKALTASNAGKWRYRIGDYRLIAKIDDGRIIIIVLAVGHRRDIYDR